LICFFPANSVHAENKYLTDENIIPEATYSFEGQNADTIYYKIVPPATIPLNLRITSLSTTNPLGEFALTCYNSNWDEDFTIRINSDKTYTIYFDNESTCYFAFRCSSSGLYSSDFSGKFECFWALSTPTVTLKSEKSGKMTVIATKSSDKEYCDGYEIAYRKKGEKWKTKKVETTGALQETISGLSKGKTYTVKIRQYVEDDNNKIYYSGYSKKVKIKIKK
jgi:hypothetical protein